MTATSSYVQNLYRTILQRGGETAGVDWWVGQAGAGMSAAQMVSNFIGSAEAQNVTAILHLYDVFFNRAADSGGLGYWVNALNRGTSLLDIAKGFAASSEFQVKVAGASTADYVEATYGNLFGRASDDGGKAYWIQKLDSGALTRAEVSLAFSLSPEALASGGAATRFTESYLVLRASGTAEPTASAVEALATKSLSAALAQKIGSYDTGASFTITGKIVDGYLSGATVFADANGDGVWNEGEAIATTDAKGNFSLDGAKGALVASGGTDLSTGKAFKGVLKAPEGSTMVNPLTSLQQGFVEKGLSAADAEFKVAKALGLDASKFDLTTFDPLAASLDTSASAEDRALGAQLQAQAAKVANLLVAAGSTLIGAAGGAARLDAASASNSLLDAMVDAIAADSDGVVSFSDQAMLQGIINDAVIQSGNADLQAASAKVAGLADEFAAMSAASADNVDKAVAAGGDVNAMMANIAQASVVAQGTMADQMQAAAASGDLSAMQSNFTGAAFDKAADKATIGDLDPNSTTDDAAAAASNSGAGASDSPAPDTSAPVFLAATVNDRTLVLRYGEALDEDALPPASAFTVTADGTAQAAPTDVVVDSLARTVTLTLASPIANGQTVTVSYTDLSGDDSDAIQDAAGNDSISLLEHAVSNTTPDTTAPLMTGAAVSGRVLVLSYDEALDAANLPPPTAFVIKVGGIAQASPINGVVDAETQTITLTLAAPVTIGQVVTVSYADPTTDNDLGAIQDSDGNDAISVNVRAVSNDTPAAPVFQSATVAGSTLVLNYVGTLDEDAVAPAGAFAVKVNGVVQAAPTAVVVNQVARTVTLTLASAVTNGQDVSVSYSDPTGDNDIAAIQDSAGNDAVSISNQAVVNNTLDVIAPLFSKAGVGVSGKTLVLTYNEALDAANPPPAGAFSVTVDGVMQTPTKVVVDAIARTVTLTLATQVVFGQTVALSYSDPTAANDVKAIQDKAGNDAISVTGLAVTNNASDAPVFDSAAINGNTLVLTYGEALDAANPPPISAFSVKVDGTAQAAPTALVVDSVAKTVTLTLATAVTNGQAVRLSYTDPTGNTAAAIQDAAGNDAGTIENQAVTNYTPPVFSGATASGNTLVLSYSAALDAANTPPASAFVVTAGGAAQAAPTKVVVDSAAKNVTLTLAAAVNSDQLVTVSYADPTGNTVKAIQDLAGNDAISLSNAVVSNVSLPLFLGATVNSNTLVLTYSESLDATHSPLAGAFAVNVGGTAQVAPTAVAVAGNTVTLTLAAAVTSDQKVSVSYVDPSSANDLAAIQSASGSDAATVRNRPVTNSTPDVAAPVFSSASVSGDKLVLTYSEALDASHLPLAAAFSVKVGVADSVAPTAISVDSLAKTVTLTLTSAAAYGEAVTFDYAPTAGNITANAVIQDTSGNDAAALSGKIVTNLTTNALAPTLSVVATAGLDVNKIVLAVTGVLPGGTDHADLSFSVLPAGAVVKNAASEVVTSVANFSGTQVFTVEFAKADDFNQDLVLTLTGKAANGDAIGHNVQTIDLIYDVASSTELLSFVSNNQNMWGNFDGSIEWHEYIPLIGEAPIVWNAVTEKWDTVSNAEYWRSGEFNVINVDIDSTRVMGAVSKAANIVLNTAKGVFDDTAYLVDKVVGDAFALANRVFDTAESAFYYGARTVDTAVRNTFEAAKSVYNVAKSVYDGASYAFNAVATGLHNASESAWIAHDNWYNSLDWVGKAWYGAAHGVAWAIQAAADVVYDVATGLWNGAKYAFETVATGVYNTALGIYNAAAGAVDGIAKATFALAEKALDTAQQAYDAAMKLVHDGAQAVYDVAQKAVYTTLDSVNKLVHFDTKLKLDADVFAQVGLQVDFALDLGSVDTAVDYQLTSLTQYNHTTDMLAITPTMLNMTTGTEVAFETISPNVKFYAALIYDVGTDVDLFVDGKLLINNKTIFNLSPSSNGLTIPLSVSTNSLADLMGVVSGGNINVGTLVLVDLDSTQLEPYEVPFLEALTKNILSLQFALPTLETEGLAAAYDAAKTFKEGDLVNVDFSTISSAFFNTIKAKIDFSAEMKAKYHLDSLAGKTLADMVTTGVTAVMSTIWDLVGGKAEAIPIFVIDTTDETSNSLLHLNLIPDSVIASTTSTKTGSLGFYSAYGESDPVVKFTIDVDAAAALVVNEILKAVATAASGGTAASVSAAIPLINPLDLDFGIDMILKKVAVPQVQIDEVTKYVDLGFKFEAADLDASASVNFSQKFTLSIDDMAYVVTFEDNSTQISATANGGGKLVIKNASSHDANKDGVVGYTLKIVPKAMFSNDTEAGLSLGYTLDFLKGQFAAGVKLPLDKLLGLTGADWLNIAIPGIDIGLGPLLSIKGKLDVLDVDVFESRFDMNVGSATYAGEIELVGIA